jgi:hypothetical protein
LRLIAEKIDMNMGLWTCQQEMDMKTAVRHLTEKMDIGLDLRLVVRVWAKSWDLGLVNEKWTLA